MNRKTQIELVKDLHSSMIDVLVSKSKDYATEDVLSNFKRMSKVAETLNIDVKTPGGFARFMVLLKLDRINNLLTSGRTPENESVQDSFVDLINYSQLDYCIAVEEQQIKNAVQEKKDKEMIEFVEKSEKFPVINAVPLGLKEEDMEHLNESIASVTSTKGTYESKIIGGVEVKSYKKL